MEDLVQEFAVRTDLKGAELVSKLRARMPGATIDVILDATRLIQTHQLVERLRVHEFENVLDLIEHLSSLSITDEDLDTLTRILEDNRGAWISDKCSHELSDFLKNGMFRSTLILISKLRTSQVQEPSGCFTWAWRPCTRPRSP